MKTVIFRYCWLSTSAFSTVPLNHEYRNKGMKQVMLLVISQCNIQVELLVISVSIYYLIFKTKNFLRYSLLMAFNKILNKNHHINLTTKYAVVFCALRTYLEIGYTTKYLGSFYLFLIDPTLVVLISTNRCGGHCCLHEINNLCKFYFTIKHRIVF